MVTPEDLAGARSTRAAADLFGYSYRHMHRLVSSGKIEAFRLNGRILIPQRAITNYLSEHAEAVPAPDQANERVPGEK